MKKEFKYYPEFSLAIEKYSGKIDFEAFLEFTHYLYSLPEFGTARYLLTDFRNSEAVFESEQIDQLAKLSTEFYLSQPKSIGVIIVSKPYETALAKLYSDQTLTNKRVFHVCSTFEKAAYYFKYNLSAQEIEKMANEL